MPGPLKNCYHSVYRGAYQALRNRLAKPLSLLLLCVFLSTHAIAAYTELREAQQPDHRLKAAELSDCTPAAQQSEAANMQKLRGERAGAANLDAKRLEARNHSHQIALVTPPSTASRQFFSRCYNLCGVLRCEDPFSSRPPPAASPLQG